MQETNKNLLKILGLAAAVIIVVAGVLFYYSSRSPVALENIPPVSTSTPLTTTEELRLGVEAKNNKDCRIAITHFSNSLKENTELATEDQAKVWFWKGMCEYELGMNVEADNSFTMVKKVDPNNTSADSYKPLE